MQVRDIIPGVRKELPAALLAGVVREPLLLPVEISFEQDSMVLKLCYK